MTTKQIAAVFGAVGVAMGAFGAHFGVGRFGTVALELWKLANLYHLVHAAAMLASGRADGRPSPATFSFAVGIVLFSGSFYAFALLNPGAATDTNWLFSITPFGGLAFIAGWLLLLRKQ